MSRSYVPGFKVQSLQVGQYLFGRILTAEDIEKLEPKRVADLAERVADKLKSATPQTRPNRYRRIGRSRLRGMSDSGNA